MAELTQRMLVIGIIALVVFALTAIFAPKAFGEVFSFFKTDFDDLKPSEKAPIQNNLNSFINSLITCRAINDESCVCKNVLPNFPASFPETIEIALNKQGNDAVFAPKFSKKEISNMNQTISLTTFSKVQLKSDVINEQKDERGQNIILSFKEQPVFETTKKYFVISDSIYKSMRTVLAFAVSTSKISDSQKEAEFFSQLPVCADKRIEAISKFDSFISSLNAEKTITINIPDNYKIFVYKNAAMLQHNDEAVKKYTSEMAKPENVIYAKEIRCEKTSNMNLLNGDKISVRKEANGFCISKITASV